ncbi:MAG: ABC transporter substrate-binding protein [Acidimicrobiales bacterium]
MGEVAKDEQGCTANPPIWSGTGQGDEKGLITLPSRRSQQCAIAVCLVLASLVAACSGARFDRGVQQVAADGSVVAGDGEASPDGEATDPSIVVEGAPGAPGTSDGSNGPGTSAGGPGHSSGGPDYISGLFSAREDSRGITKDEIRLCAHAALTYAAAFNTSAADLNVYWSAINDAGGIYGRQVRAYYENDNYTPTDAQKAATACLDKFDPFILLGGIGFDQIPSVRNFAEQRRVLYLHHTATVNGSEGKQFSYTALPTTEKMGEVFAELAITRFPGKPVGIVKRQSENWEPGIDGFKRVAVKHGVKIVLDRPVPQNKGSYLQDIVELQNAGAKVVFLWLNALESTTFIKQSKAQGFSPQFMVFPFNLTMQTLGADALNPPITGVLMANAYSFGDYSGPFAAYADDMKQFEAQYAKYRPNVDLGGVSGDLLFLNWSAQKSTHQLLLRCGPDCGRNRFVQVMRDFRGKPTSSACESDFGRPGPGNDHRGGWVVSTMEAYRSPSGAVNMRNLATCVEHLL